MKRFIKFVLGIVVACVILVIVGVVIAAFTANKAVQTVDTSIKQVQKATDDKDALLQQMLNKAPKPVVTKDQFSYTVEYTLTNDTKETFDYIQLSADVFDKTGAKLGNDMTNITNVTPGQTFKLKLDLYQDGATSYKITSITSSPLK